MESTAEPDTRTGDCDVLAAMGDATPGQKNGEGQDEDSPKRETSKNLIHIDRNQIETVPGSSSGVGELQNLGVDVISQEDFEKGVLDQVDRAISVEEEKATKARAQRDLDTIQTDIRLVTRELNKLDKVHTTMKKQGIQRNISSIVVQQEEKQKQLKILNKRRKSLCNAIEGKPVVDSSDDGDDGPESEGGRVLRGLLTEPTDAGLTETRQQRLIRLGELTPFDVMAPTTPEAEARSDFARFLGAKDVSTVKKHVERSKWKGRPPEGPKAEPQVAGVGWRSVEDAEVLGERARSLTERARPKFHPSDRKRRKGVVGGAKRADKKRGKKSRGPRLPTNWDSDRDEMVSGAEDGESDGGNRSDDMSKTAAATADKSVEDETVLTPPTKKRKQKSRAERIEDGEIANLDELKESFAPKSRLSAADRVVKCVDDATQESYYKRLRANKQTKDKAKKEERKKRKGEVDATEEDGEESDSGPEDAELKGGLIIPGSIWHKLYRYQMTGVRWMWELHQQRAGGVMGDEMGLGKTIQMIAFLAGLKHSLLRDPEFRYEGLGPVIIICPATVMHQWVKEFHKWSPDFRVAILHSSGSYDGLKGKLVRDIVNSHSVLVTSYSTCRIHQELLNQFRWHYVILDEGHKIRNPDAEMTIACKQFKTPHRLILTGSPLQNNLQELWSLFDFVFPGKLGTLPVFLEKFSVPITQGGYANASSVQVQTAYKCACVLRDTINPYLLRRMKADVQQNIQLPSKSEQVLFCRLSVEQKETYRDYLDSRECHQIMKGEYQIFAGLITMRKICNHPHLVTGGPRLMRGEEESLPLEERYGHWSKAGKMVVIESLLKIWKKQGHRVLLFSQSKQMLDIIESFVSIRYTYLRLDGTTAISSRQNLINRFNQNSSIYVFILTTRVGGLGVNLTGANRVIIYDPDWNPSTDTQARERAWRIGQKREVTIYRLLTAGTIEEKIYHRQIYKHFLTNRVLKDPRQRRFFKSNDLFELFTLNECSETTETSAIFAGTGSNIQQKKNRKNWSPRAPDPPRKRPQKVEPPRREGVRRSERQRSGNRDTAEAATAKPAAGPICNGDVPSSSLKRTASSSSLKRTAPLLSLKRTASSSSLKRTASETENRISSSEGKFPKFPKKLVDPADRSESGPISDGDAPSCSLERTASENEISSTEGRFTIPKRLPERTEGTQKGVRKVFDFSNIVSQDEDPGSGSGGASDVSRRIKKTKVLRREAEPSVSSSPKTVKKKKKRKKDAKLDGVRITNLAKHRTVKPTKDSDNDANVRQKEKKTHQQQDELVLEKLFKKSGIHSALRHDNIMESSNPDYVLVENEASRVAREAAKALKQSRRICPTARSGIPTWTGTFGQVAAVQSKPRFGQKLNAKLAGPISKQTSTVADTSEDKEKLFHGDEAIRNTSSLQDGAALPSSRSLLAKMRARNQVQISSEGGSGSGEDGGPSSRMVPIVFKKYEDLINEVKVFIASHARVPGRATTDEILRAFQRKLATEDTPVFRSMLRQVCDFRRDVGGRGTWQLKAEYL